MEHKINLEFDQRSSSKQIILRYADKCAPASLAVLYLLVVCLNLFQAGKTALLGARLLFSLSFAIYVAVLLHRQSEKGWSWSGRSEVWCAAKESVVSAAGYCRQNYTRVIYYAIIFLYGTALLFTDGGTDSHYVRMVTLLAPALVAVAKLFDDSHGHRGRASQEQIPQLSAVV